MTPDRRKSLARFAWASPLVLGLGGWGARSYDHAKLDSARFVADSINDHYRWQELRVTQQHDSATLRSICLAVRCEP